MLSSIVLIYVRSFISSSASSSSCMSAVVTLKEAMLLINVCFSAREWKEEEKEE